MKKQGSSFKIAPNTDRDVGKHSSMFSFSGVVSSFREASNGAATYLLRFYANGNVSRLKTWMPYQLCLKAELVYKGFEHFVGKKMGRKADLYH